MRITAEEAIARGIVQFISVYLDDELVQLCVEADEDEGYVTLIAPREGGLGVDLVRREGKVRILGVPGRGEQS